MENLVTSKEVSEKLKKLGVKKRSFFYWSKVARSSGTKYEPIWADSGEYPSDLIGEFAAFTVSELGELLKPYMKDIEISARDDIFNPDFWGNYLISKLSEK